MSQPEVIGRFKVLESIGAGGMAEVFLGVPVQRLADDPPFVALKRLLPAVAAAQPETQKMFLDEAAILSRLNHRNIVRLIDVCSGSGSTYLVMELLDGVDLSAVIKRFAAEGKSLPHAFSASVVADIANALSYATRAQTIDGKSMELVHRDISPQNIFIQTDGSVRLLDFGVARANDRMTTTRTGMLKGKLSYMSPEQAACEPLDHRSDIFALGIVLYELTIGRRPFRGKNEFKLLQQIIECKIVWPTEIFSSYPQKLQRVLERMLARDPADRYRDSSDAARDLRDYLSDVSIASSFTPRSIMATHFADKIEAARARTARYADVVVGMRDDDALSLSLDALGIESVSGISRPPQPAEAASTAEAMPIEKEIGDFETRVVVHRYVAAATWRRSIDGLEGSVTIRFETDEDAAPHVQGLVAGLEQLTEDIATVRLERAPEALVRVLVEHPELAHVITASRRTACPRCNASVIVVGESARCDRCGHAYRAPVPQSAADQRLDRTVPELKAPTSASGATVVAPYRGLDRLPTPMVMAIGPALATPPPAPRWKPELPSFDGSAHKDAPAPPIATDPPRNPAVEPAAPVVVQEPMRASSAGVPPLAAAADVAPVAPVAPVAATASAAVPVRIVVLAAVGGSIVTLVLAAVAFVLLK